MIDEQCACIILRITLTLKIIRLIIPNYKIKMNERTKKQISVSFLSGIKSKYSLFFLVRYSDSFSFSPSSSLPSP